MNPRARSRARRYLVRATACAVTAAAVLLCALCTAAGAATGSPPGRPAPHGAAGLTLFRLDVSHYPQVGLVVTVPGAAQLGRGDFRVIEGRQTLGPWVRQLSPDDIELALAPEAYLSAAGLRSLIRLLAMPGDNFVVLVIDDGSDDNTVATVSGVAGDRVWLLSRKLPNARQGKGEALNAAVRYLTDCDQLAGRDADNGSSPAPRGVPPTRRSRRPTAGIRPRPTLTPPTRSPRSPTRATTSPAARPTPAASRPRTSPTHRW